jgi:hypothetical protein
MNNLVTQIMTMFDRFKPDPTPEDHINRIEKTLESALSRRQSVREELKNKRRKARLERRRAEEQLDTATGERLTELRQHIDSQDQIIQEYQDRVETLTNQITAIRKRFPKLRVLRTDIELMKDLREDTSWQDDVENVMRKLQTEDPVSGSADSELNTLLGTVDYMIDDTDNTTPTDVKTPTLNDEIDESETYEDEQHSSQ